MTRSNQQADSGAQNEPPGRNKSRGRQQPALGLAAAGSAAGCGPWKAEDSRAGGSSNGSRHGGIRSCAARRGQTTASTPTLASLECLQYYCRDAHQAGHGIAVFCQGYLSGCGPACARQLSKGRERRRGEMPPGTHTLPKDPTISIRSRSINPGSSLTPPRLDPGITLSLLRL